MPSVVVELRDDEVSMVTTITSRCRECQHLDAMHDHDRDCGTRWCCVVDCECVSDD